MPKLLYPLTAFLCFAIGACAVWLFASQAEPVPLDKAGTEIVRAVDIETVHITALEFPKETDNPLANIWVESPVFSYLGYQIEKQCTPKGEYETTCSLAIRKGARTLDRFELAFGGENWLQFGLFDFLGSGKKQLVVFTYSGGAHCCYDYAIYDLSPKFRNIYDSRLIDSANDVGNELVPIDLNRDGVYEFQRSVMAFDYWFASHASSAFPPVIFQYDWKLAHYQVANKKFSGFIESQYHKWYEREDTYIHSEESTRARILYLIYAGERDRAWRIFDRDYNFSEKQRFELELKRRLARDPTYGAIYSGR